MASSRQIKKNKLGVIDGKIPKPKLPEDTYSFETNAWEMVNSMIKSYIMNVVDPKLHTSVAMSNRRMLCGRIFANDIQSPMCLNSST